MGYYHYRMCGSHEPETESDLPPPPDTTKAYFVSTFYTYGTGCTGQVTTVAYYVEGECVYSGNGFYVKRVLDPSGTSTTEYYCRSEICDCTPTTIAFEGSCLNTERVYSRYPPPPPPPTVFSTPYDLAMGTELKVDVPVSGERNCYAAVGSTVLPGWTVTYQAEEVRGRGALQ